MGPLGGPVHATAQAGGRVEVFWKGLGNNHVWAAFRGAGGWHGPAQLGGNVVSPPWPVTAAGAVHLLWRGPHGWLWHERRTARGRWRAAARLRMTGLRAAPFAAGICAGLP
jgi:hypothetical protein